MVEAAYVMETILILLLILVAFIRIWPDGTKKAFGSQYTALLMALGGNVLVFVELLILCLEEDPELDYMFVGACDTVGFGLVYASCVLLYVFQSSEQEPGRLRVVLQYLAPALLGFREAFELADFAPSKPSSRYLAVTFLLIFHFLLFVALIIASVSFLYEPVPNKSFTMRRALTVACFTGCIVMYAIAVSLVLKEVQTGANWCFIPADILLLLLPYLTVFFPKEDAKYVPRQEQPIPAPSAESSGAQAKLLPAETML